jgi:hypothetical protein
MSLTNQVENRILIAGSMAATLLGVWLIFRLFIVPTYTTQIEFLQKQNAAKDETITELAKIARYSINNDFEKMRTKKGGSIVLDLDNTLEAQELIIPQNEIPDSIIINSKQKLSLWEKLFGKKKN